jgi:hypothetical protein
MGIFYFSICVFLCFGLSIYFIWVAGRNGGSNNKSGSLRRGEASGSKNGFAKSLGTTIAFNYSSPDVQVCLQLRIISKLITLSIFKVVGENGFSI